MVSYNSAYTWAGHGNEISYIQVTGKEKPVPLALIFSLKAVLVGYLLLFPWLLIICVFVANQ